MKQLETITAIATPPGKGGVGIIRVSGPKALEVAKKILNFTPKPRYAHYCDFLDPNNSQHIIDQGIALFFPNPHSFTGEDVFELQGHGGPVVLDQLLKTILSLGSDISNIRLAKPGEFSEQAFLNNKLDLTQAEAIADLINAESEQAARSAMRSLQGEFSSNINNLVQELINLRIYVEAAIDFPEEEIDFIKESTVISDLEKIFENLNSLLSKANQGVLLQEGMSVVIAGPPNAGKSSLLNLLSGKNSAIVTDIAGTTRDVLKEYIQIDGMPVHIIDTAGIRETDDVIEQEGVKRAREELYKADVVLCVLDSSKNSHHNIEELLPDLPSHLPVIKIFNKIDLINFSPKQEDNSIYLSVKNNMGIELLKNKLKNIMGYEANNTQGNFIARRRHIDCLNQARNFLDQGLEQIKIHNAGELLAEDLRLTQEALSQITGEFSSDDLLGEIFSSFCIGK